MVLALTSLAPWCIILLTVPQKSNAETGILSSEDTATLKGDTAGDARKYLEGAPQCISLIGQLMVLVAGTGDDFSLSDAVPLGGFKHMKFPDSFAATLTQVTNEAQRALTGARNKMSAIESAIKDTPTELQTMLNMVYGMDLMQLKYKLHLQVRKISRSFDIATKKACSISGDFIHVSDLINEVVLTITVAKRIRLTKLRRLSGRLKLEQKKHETAESMLVEIKKRGKRLEKEVDERRKAYDKAIANIPSSWERVAQDLVQGITKGLAKMADSLVPALENFDFNNDQQEQQAAEAGLEPGTRPMSPEAMKANDEKEKNVQAFFTLGTTLMTAMNEIDASKEDLFMLLDKEHEEGDNADKLSTIQKTVKETPIKMFRDQLKLLPAGHPKTVEITGFVDTMAALSKELQDYAEKSAPIEEEDRASFQKRMDQIMDKLEPIAIGEVMARGGPSQVDASLAGTSKKGKQLNEEFVAQMQQQALKMSKARAERNQDLQDKQVMKVTKLTNMIKGMAQRKTSIENILKVMAEAVKILSSLKTNWQLMVTNFNAMSDAAKIISGSDTKQLIEHAKKIKEVGETSETGKQAVIHQLRALAAAMQGAASTLRSTALQMFKVSSVYVKISDKYIVPKLAELTKSLSAVSKSQKASTLLELEDYAKTATAEIKEEAKKEQDRVEALRREVDEKLEKAANASGVPIVSNKQLEKSVSTVDDLMAEFGDMGKR